MTNKFDFIEGKEYVYDELPQPVKDDVDVQFDIYDDPNDYVYRGVLLSPEDSIEYLESVFGEYDITDAMDHPYMIELVRDITFNGLDYPPVGEEGNHRALAFYMMGENLPYLEIIPKR